MNCGQQSASCCYFKNAYQENKLNEEIDFGIGIRKNRQQEKDIYVAKDAWVVSKTKINKNKKERKSIKNKKNEDKHPKIPKCGTHKVKNKADRTTASLQEYMQLLATPKKCICADHYGNKNKNKKEHGVCSPRCCQLAMPNKKRVFMNWKDFYQVLAPEKILFLKDLLYKKDSLKPIDAYRYFNRLAKAERKKQKQKKRKRQELERSKPQKSKVVHEINLIANKIIKFFYRESKQNVKCIHIMLANIMKQNLEEKHIIRKGHRRDNTNDICSQSLYRVLDQVAVWLESTISYDDEESTEGEEEESSSSSESSEESREEDITQELYDEYEKLIKEMGGEEEEAMKEIVRESDLYEDEEEEEEVGISMAGGEGQIEGEGGEMEEGVYEQVEKELIPGGEEEEVAKIDVSLFDYSPSEDETIFIKEDAGQSYIVEARPVPSRISKEEETSNELEVIPEEEEEQLQLLPEEEAEAATAEAEATAAEAEIEAIPEEEKLAEIEEEIKHIKIEEHMPQAVCCITMKTWATWLIDVAQNTHAWCQWIQEVIAKIRFFTAIIKGQIKTPSGKLRILYNEEWDEFVSTLNKDIESWEKYNRRVKELSEEIITTFRNSKNICCIACLQTKLIINADSARQVTDQLIEALSATNYWRSWLSSIVEEAKKIATLDFHLPSAEDLSVTDSADVPYHTKSSSYDSSSYIHELIELNKSSIGSSSTSDTSSMSTSAVIIEEENKDTPAVNQTRHPSGSKGDKPTTSKGESKKKPKNK